MVDAALNVAAEQIVEHSAYGALLERDGNRGPTAAPQNLYLTADADDDGRARRLGRDRGGDRRAVARPSATRSVDPAWAMDPALTTAAGRRAAARRHRRPPVELVRRAERRRDRRLPLGGGRPGRQGDAAPRAGDAAAAAGPRLLRGRSTAPVTGHRPAQHAADPVLPRAPTGSTAARRRCWASTTTRCCAASASPTTRWPSSRTHGVIGRVPDTAPEVGSPRAAPARLRPGRSLARALDRAGLERHARPGMAAVVSVMRAEQIFLRRATDILRPLGLTFARYQVLGMLRWAGPLTLGAVGHRLWITPGHRDQLDRPPRGGGPVPPRVPPHRRPRHARSRSPPRAGACSTAPSRS